MVERSHQSLDGQVTKGQEHKTWKQLWTKTNQRRKVLNQQYPSRCLGKKAPLQVYPQAKHCRRFYHIEKEEQLIDLNRIYRYLSTYCWYRKVSNVKTVSLDAKIYYLKNAKPETQLQIKFCNTTKKLIFPDVNELIVAKLPIKDFSKQKVMEATTQQLIAMKKKLSRTRDFPL